MWTRVLGATKDLSKLTRGEWEAFADARRSGAVSAQGVPVEDPAAYRVEELPSGAWGVVGPSGKLMADAQPTRAAAAALVPQRVPVRQGTVRQDLLWGTV